jgi:hypothetical protein
VSGVNSAIDFSTVIPSLTDSGQQAFFESPDRLVPEDANEAVDVYEWRAAGSSAPGADTCQRPDGCLALISSGQGERDTELYGMSADGHDVFFRTEEKLVAADALGGESIYDARVGGGIPEASSEAPCEGDACQGHPSEPPHLAAPATLGSAGAGPEGAKNARCAKRKPKARANRRARCGKRRRHGHHHRHHRGRRGLHRNSRRSR